MLSRFFQEDAHSDVETATRRVPCSDAGRGGRSATYRIAAADHAAVLLMICLSQILLELNITFDSSTLQSLT